jgi:hypothetical protein
MSQSSHNLGDLFFSVLSKISIAKISMYFTKIHAKNKRQKIKDLENQRYHLFFS